MSKKTAMLIPPSLEEVELQAAKIALPIREAEKFFHYYTANGWKVGKNKMVCWTNALAHWRLVWLDRQQAPTPEAKKHWAVRELEAESRRIAKELEAEKKP